MLVRLPLTWLPFPCVFSCVDLGVSRTNAGDPVTALTSRLCCEVFLLRNRDPSLDTASLEDGSPDRCGHTRTHAQ